MSRIGKKPIEIPKNVNVNINNRTVTVKGPKGELKKTFPWVQCKIENNFINLLPETSLPKYKAFWGLSRSLIQGMLIGVSQGFKKELKIVGTGYRVAKDGKNISLNVGYSSPWIYKAPDGITFEIPDNTTIIVTGIDKQKVGQVAAEIRKIRPPEPYKGKGIRYKDEKVRKKEGKSK